MVLIRLAMALGRTPRELLQSITSAELTELLAFNALEPVGEYRADLRAGVIAAAVANFGMRDLKEQACAGDFMPVYREVAQQATDQDGIYYEDPEEQTKLVKQLVFGLKEEK